MVKMLPALLFFVFQPFPPLWVVGGGGKIVMVGDCCAAGFQG